MSNYVSIRAIAGIACAACVVCPVWTAACGARGGPDGARGGAAGAGAGGEDDASEFSPLAREVQALVRPLIADDWLFGVSVGLIALGPENTRRIFYDAGKVEADGPTPSRNTVYEIGSASKLFTALLLADMAERRLVALEAPVASLLPASVRVPDKDGTPITLAHLASHTSGLPRLPDNLVGAGANPDAIPDAINDPYAGYDVAALYEYLAKAEIATSPGEVYAYSNLGAGLLGHALALRAGMSYEAAVKERVTAPLEMTSTSIELTDDMRARLARGHSADGDPVPGWEFQVLAGAGAWRSTARDMLAFVDANLRLQPSDLAAAMRATHIPRSPVTGAADGEKIALGWHVDPRGVRWHNGQTGGYHSFVAFWPERKLGVVVLANSASGVVDALGQALLSLLAGTPTPLKLPVTAPVAPEVLARYVGRYQLPIAMVMEVTADGDKLYVQATGQPRFRVYPTSDTRFYWRAVEASIRFQVNRDGVVTGAVVEQGGAAMQARKIK